MCENRYETKCRRCSQFQVHSIVDPEEVFHVHPSGSTSGFLQCINCRKVTVQDLISFNLLVNIKRENDYPDGQNTRQP